MLRNLGGQFPATCIIFEDLIIVIYIFHFRNVQGKHSVTVS